MTGIFIIELPEQYVISIPDMSGNETNPDFNLMLDKYCNNILRRGWKVWNGGGKLHAEIKSLVVDELLLILAFGGTVQYYNPYIKVATADLDNQIPTGLPNRTYLQNEMETVHTWRTWRSDIVTRPITEIEGFGYFISCTFDQTLTSSELYIIHSSVDAELVDEIPAILPLE